MIVKRVGRITSRRLQRFRGPEDGDDDQQVDIHVNESTALKGIGMLVVAGALTHVAVRLVDAWFFDNRRR